MLLPILSEFQYLARQVPSPQLTLTAFTSPVLRLREAMKLLRTLLRSTLQVTHSTIRQTATASKSTLQVEQLIITLPFSWEATSASEQLLQRLGHCKWHPEPM